MSEASSQSDFAGAPPQSASVGAARSDAVDLFELFLARTSASPAETALREKTRGLRRSVTWSELEREVSFLAVGIRELGFSRGDVAVVVGETRRRLLTTVLAVLALGGVVLPLDPRAGASSIGAALEGVRVRVAFVENRGQLDAVATFLGGAVSSIIVDGRRASGRLEHEGIRDYETVCDAGARSAGWLSYERRAPTAPAFQFVRAGERGEGARTVRHLDLIAAGAAASGLAGLGTADEVVVAEPLASSESAVVAWSAWLTSGFTLNTVEHPESAAVDIREVAPSVAFASDGALTDLRDRTALRIGAAGSARRRLFDWALHRASPVSSEASLATRPGGSSFAGWVARTAVLAPLADRLGLSRLRVVIGTGEVGEYSRRFVASLGADVREVAVPWSSHAPLRSERRDVETDTSKLSASWPPASGTVQDQVA